MDYKKSIWIIVLFLFLISCHQKDENENKKTADVNYDESLMKANQYLVKTEEEQINDFLARYNWEMKETGTGLRYNIYKNNHGKKAQIDQIVRIKYEIRLISGDVIYNSDDLGIREFRIGKGDVETGLHEAVLLMGVGDKAKLILPSHLAYGLAGDQNKIPKRATLVYDIELISLQ